MQKIWQSNKLNCSDISDNQLIGTQLMFMGTGSDVGKSMIVAGLCRLFANKNIKVAPFKSQNMSNNAAVAQIFDLDNNSLSDDMGEIGRAQWLQAKAAKIPPTTNMNPILLKPENEVGSQVIVNGKKFKSLKAREYYRYKPKFLSVIMQSYQSLKAAHEMVLIEGAGSPAEVNLRKNDIANMGFAEQANVPVILIGDIDRGGVIAAIVGTYEVMSNADRARIKGFIINKFRGDISLFDDAIEQIEKMTGWQSLGVLPYFKDAHLLPAEDSMGLEKANSQTLENDLRLTRKLRILVPKLPHIANFDDLDPLIQHPNIDLEFVSSGRPLPLHADLIILPGSKSTIADLQFLYQQGWDIDIKSHLRHGGKILGICGGFQMLGKKIFDPTGVEGKVGEIDALGLLDIETNIKGDKSTKLTSAIDLYGNRINAYEIHIGKTIGDALARPMFKIDGRNVGCISADDRVMGSYLHGIFSNANFTIDFLKQLGVDSVQQDYNKRVEDTLDNLAKHIETHLNFKPLLEILASS